MKTWLVFVMLIVFLLSVWLHASYNRYTMVSAATGSLPVAYKLDKLTGKVSHILIDAEGKVTPK